MFPKLANPKVLYVNLCGLIMMWKQGKVDGSLFSIKKKYNHRKQLSCIRNRNIILYNDLYDDNLSFYNYNVQKT
jgi:hypothetical protein